MYRAENIVTTKAVITQALSANGPRETFARGRTEISDNGAVKVTPFPRQDSSLMTPFAKANVLLRLPPNTGPWAEGDVIDVVSLTP